MRLSSPLLVFRFHRLALSTVLALLTLAVFAAEESLLADLPFDDLTQREVVSASAIARQIGDSPSAVAIVTAADIRAYGYRTLADVINGIRGLYTTSDRRYHYMGGRGFGEPGDYAGRVMVLIDGYVTQDPLFNQAYIDESGFVDLELVERVEYVPGTGSVIYGNNAMLGIINVITRKGGDFKATQLSTEFSSHGGRKQRVTSGHRFDNGADLLLSASAYKAHGDDHYFAAYDTPATNNGVASRIDGEGSQRLFGKFSYNGLMLEAGYVDRKKDVPSKPTKYTLFNTPFVVEDRNAFVNAAYETDLSLQLRSVSRFYLGHYAYENRRIVDVTGDLIPEPYARRMHEAQWWGLDQKFVGNWFAGHTVLLGFEFRNDYRQKMRKSYFSPTGTLSSDESDAFHRRTGSFYLTDEWRLSELWRLNIGARYDKASDLEGNWSPRLAAIYQPSFQTTIKASYSEAFRMPNADERAGYGSAAAPEYVAARELVLQHDFTPRVRFSSSLYEYRRTKQMVYISALGADVPVGNSRTRGVEGELDSSWSSGLRARGSVAFQHAHDTDDRDLVNSPNLLGKFNVTAPLPGDWLRAGFEAQYLGARYTSERRRLGGVGLAHLTLSSEQKWLGFSATFSIRNLFDRDYEVASPFTWAPGTGIDVLRMDGRSYWLQLNMDL